MASNYNVPYDGQVMEKLNQLKSYLRTGNSLGILVWGKTGVGKSSLINSIYHGAEVAEEGDSVKSVTEFIVSYSMSVDTPYIDEESDTTTILTTWDTPGFGDAFASANRKQQRIDQLVRAIEKADVLLYCFKIMDRMSESDVDGIVKITKASHPDIWRKSVFVLTFSNEIKIPPSSSNTNLVSYFNSKVEEWNTTIRFVLREQAGIPEDIVEDISVVPVGYRGDSPLDRKDWYAFLGRGVQEDKRIRKTRTLATHLVETDV